MRSFNKLGVLALAVFALSASGAASASAATFTASATGSLSGKATNTQTWTTNGGQIKCTTAETSGTIVSTASTNQDVEVKYSNCTAYGFASVHINPAKYRLTVNGTLHLLNTVTINLTLGGCDTTITPQSLNLLQFTNNLGRLFLLAQLAQIVYHSNGGLCGASGSNGTFSGGSELQRVGGGSISWDA